MSSPLHIFMMSFDPDTSRAAMAGNIPPEQALQLLQQLIIANAVEQAKLHLQEASDGKQELSADTLRPTS